MNSLLSYIGLQKSSTDTDKTPVRALPASWYTSAELYELERRSIFSKKWLLTTHKSRFSAAGDWLRYEIAGFEFILVKDREGVIRAFHNVCRHRAYPIVLENQGCSRIFTCKYHGWSYGLNGTLAKAVGYQELEGFDKSKNSLLPIHVHIDHNGFVWVNLDAQEKPENSWNVDFEGMDSQPRLADYHFEEYEFDHIWEMEGDYNWKICADNYNECYHCAVAHPDIPTIADLSTYYVETGGGNVRHYPSPKKEQVDAGLKVAVNYYFPNASMNVSPHMFFIQRFVPCGVLKTKMVYEVYRNKNSSDADFDLINEIYKRVMSEDKALCIGSQNNLNRGVFINGEMHPRMEKGPLHFQSTLRDLVTLHHELEVKAKGEIWPARQKMPDTASITDKDIKFCAGLDAQTCGYSQNSILAW